MACIGATAVVLGGANGDDAAVARERDRSAAQVICGFSIDIVSAFNPGAAIPCVKAYMACTGATAGVLGGANGDDAAVARERNRPAAQVACGFSIDIGAELVEHRHG